MEALQHQCPPSGKWGWLLNRGWLLKVSPPPAQIFIFLSDSIYHPINFWERKIWFGWNAIFFRVLKTFKFAAILVQHSHQSSLDLEWVVTYIKERDVRLDSPRLFYLCKFNLVVHTKCWKRAFCLDNEAKFAELKQAKCFIPQITSSWIYVTTLSMSIMWSAARVDRKKKGFSKNCFLSKFKTFFSKVHCMKCRIWWENKNSDDVGTLIEDGVPFHHQVYFLGCISLGKSKISQ